MTTNAIFQDPFEARYTLPPIETMDDARTRFAGSSSASARLCAERNAILLAHHYQRPEVQEVGRRGGGFAEAFADGGASTDADVIVFCGVHFMAETAAILCPEKTVLLPDLRAGCSLAASITAEELREVEGASCRTRWWSLTSTRPRP